MDKLKGGNMFSKKFALDSIERAIKTIAQVALALVTVQGFDLLHANYVGILSAIALAGLISILTSIASASFGDKDSASLVVK